MIKNIAIFKNSDKTSDKQPDYRLNAKVGEKYVEVGAGWIKDGAKGKFISVKFSEPYGERSGWELVEIKSNQPQLSDEMKQDIKNARAREGGFTPEIDDNFGM